MTDSSVAAERPAREVKLKLPRKLGFLMQMHPYKVAYGGRNSLKSWSFARALLTLGIHQDIRIICAREIQKSIKESVHQLLTDQIADLGFEDLYEVFETEIRGLAKDTLFRFIGLSDITINNVKSIEGTDVLWVEEAQNVKKRSWQIVLPTLFRVAKSECWVSFNPEMDTDETYQRFVVHPPEGAMVVQMNYRDAIACGWWSPEQERLRQYDLVHSKDDYDNIWEGKPRTVVAGAIYGKEVVEMIHTKRFTSLPYDPRFPVHRIWDLGWNDLMTVVMVQKPHPSALTVVNYLEDRFITYPQVLQAMEGLGYKWGQDWLPHDATQNHPTSGTNAEKQLKGLGCKVKLIPKSDPEARIRAARMMFARVFMDNRRFDTPAERPDRALGSGHLMERLKRYKRNVPKSSSPGTILEPSTPVHDINSHGADAWGGLAEIVDQIRNDNSPEPVKNFQGFRQPDPTMGMLA